ncbi:hypothetical protein KVR801_420013 [Klebsiella variicola]|nr:hypothetical protein KVR801_420013 [Klebsiella variicola]
MTFLQILLLSIKPFIHLLNFTFLSFNDVLRELSHFGIFSVF